MHPRLPPGLLCQHVVGKVFGGRARVRLQRPITVHSLRAQDTRLEHRFVDLRTPANQAIFRLQSAVCQVRGQAGQSGKDCQPDQTSGVGGGRPACRAAVSPACVRAAPRSILEGCMCPSDRRAEGRARRFHPILMTLRFHRPCLWPQKCTDCGRKRVHLSMCKRSAVQTAGCHLNAHVLLPCSATPRCCSEGPRRPRSCSARRSWRNASRRSTRPS